MSDQPRYQFGHRLIFLVLAIVLAAIATLVGAGWVTFTHDGILVPGALLSYFVSCL